MNKELIKQYKNEFDHWINGGDISFKIHNEWYFPTKNNEDSIFNWGCPNEVESVIALDEYADIRKAGAEGEQLQVSYDCGKTWYDKTTRKIAWSEGEEVRIKPNEWFDDISHDSPILCWAWDNNSVCDLHEPVMIVKYCSEQKLFMDNNKCKWWHSAEPIKPEECYQGEK